MSTTSVLLPWSWVTQMCVQVLCCIGSISILRCERRKRKNNDILFTSKLAQYLPLSCMAFGILYNILAALQYFNLFCYFAFKFVFVALSFQGFSMGFFQLDRLWYAFARNQVHSNHGYPLCLYYFITGYAALNIIALFIPFAFFNVTDGKCFIDANGRYHDSLNQRWDSFDSFVIGAVFYLIWDVFTVGLYVNKVCYLRKYTASSARVHGRIMNILLRILVCTWLYELTYSIDAIYVLFSLVLRRIFDYENDDLLELLVQGLCGVYSVCMSYSMLLMQEHNTSEYSAFLRVIRRFRVHYLCCCCFLSTSQAHLNEYVNGVNEEVGPNLEKRTTQNTEYQTCVNHSVKMEHSQPVELSVETADI